MKLCDLLSYDTIAIQCHDNPDADTLAAGYGLYRYFQSKKSGITLKLFYGGPTAITKPNLTGMVEALNIPVEYMPHLKEWDGLLVTVDCQHGATNVMYVKAPHVAVVDHHIQEGSLPALCDLRPSLGSCATLTWVLLTQESFFIDSFLATALYYGLFCDTDNFAEVCHPLDYDMRDMLRPDEGILRKLKHSNLSLNDLDIVSTVLKENSYDPQGRFMVIATPPCDPNLLGFVSDLAMQVDVVDVVVAFSVVDERIKFSVRTAIREVKASELAARLAKDIGSGGGREEKAGGCIARSKYRERFGGEPLLSYFSKTLSECLETCRIVDCSSVLARSEGESFMKFMKPYRKRRVRLGFVPCHKLFEGRTALQVRTLEGDTDITVDDKTILTIGLRGEVCPIDFAKFIEIYRLTGEPFSSSLPYPPTVFDRNTGLRVTLSDFADVCESSGEETILAARLESRVKVFARRDGENYVQGLPGDWIVARAPDDFYIVAADMFEELYARDYTNENLLHEDALCAVKKGLLVSVPFAAAAGVLETRDGPAPYREGDALLTGIQGDSWPMTPECFRSTYAPAPGTAPGSAGKYRKNTSAVRALRMDEPFSAALSDSKDILWGKRGDWLLQYASGEYCVAAGEIFEKTYDVYTEQDSCQ